MRTPLIVAALMCLIGVAAQPDGQDAPKPWETWQPPTVTVPQPNAFVTYQKAFALKREIDAKFVPKESPEAGPAPDRWGEGPSDMPLPARLALYDGVLALVREGLKQECLIPAPTHFSAGGSVPEFAGFRSVERLLPMEAEVRRLKSDNMGAASSALDGLAFAQAPMTQRTSIGYLVGIACEAIALRSSLDATIPLLTAPQCRTVLDRMLLLEKTRPSFAAMLAGDEISKLASLKDLIGDGEKQRLLLAEMQQRYSEAAARRAALQDMNVVDPRRELTDTQQQPDREVVARWKAHLEGMNAENWQKIVRGYEVLEQYASLPYLRRPQPPEPSDDFLVPAAEWVSRVLLKQAQALTWLHQRELQLAVRAYLLEHNQLPPDLAALVPGYLPQIPADPFGDGPMKSVMTPDGLAIYSIGPDGIDDLGRPTPDFFVDAESQGDMVVVVSAKP